MAKEQDSPWYVYTIDEGVEVGLVFANGSGQQSDNQFRNFEGWFVYSENTWYNECPSDCPGVLGLPELSVSPAGGSYEGSVSVNLTTTNQGII